MAKIKIYEFTAQLDDFTPQISRRFQVVSDIPLRKFAFILMIMFEMRGGHLYQIDTPSHENPALTRRFVLPFELAEGEHPIDNSIEYEDLLIAKLNKVFVNLGQSGTFEYDYGDGWSIRFALTDIFTQEDSRRNYPLVLEGQGYGIIEDVGGTPGLSQFIEAYKDKKSERYKELRRWSGFTSFDILKFNRLDMNKRLRYLPMIYEKTQVLNEDPTDYAIDYFMHNYRH